MATQIDTVKSSENNNFQFYYDNTINTKKIYSKILEGSNDQSLFESLAKNMVAPNEIVLRSASKKEEIKALKNVQFDKATGGYKSLVYGYVYYDDMHSVSVIPIVNVEEKWRGVIVLPPQKDSKNVVGVEELQELILAIPIKLMVNYDAVAKAVDRSVKENKGVMCVFVEGRRSYDGKVAKVILDYDFTIEAGKETADGKMDFKERRFVHNVDMGVQIAHYEDASPAINGLDIYGNVINADFDKDECYRLGRNVAVDDDKVRIISTVKGIISNANGILSVHNVIEIDKVDLSTGNIDVNGTVVIKENVTPGFKIRSEGDIIVNGNIENASIEALGNLIVSGGIIGGSESKIDISGNIYSSFISNAKVTVKGDVIVNQLINANIFSNNRIIALSGKGTIIGGNMSAQNGVFARIIGSASGTSTVITVGRDSKSDIIYKDILGNIKINRDEINKVKALLGNDYFKDPKAFLERISPDKREMVRGFLKKITELIKETSELENKKQSMNMMFEKLSHSTVSSLDGFYPGVTIYISNIKKYIDKKISGTEFYYSKEYLNIMERAPSILDEKEYEPPKEKRRD